jgi:hypothetical protein
MVECFRFGNFIGEDVESEEASERGADASNYVYDEDDAVPQEPGQELMELDGKRTLHSGSHEYKNSSGI